MFVPKPEWVAETYDIVHAKETPRFRRVFAMPSANTFSVPPIGEFVKSFLARSAVSVDPFARNCDWCTHTNDLNPETSAQSHQDAEAFLKQLADSGVRCDLGIFDPPYSPRQISECYKSIGLKVGIEETQNARLCKRVRDALDLVMIPGGIVLSFGWSSNGMGATRDYELLGILLVAHGGAHNDTICLVERKHA